MLFGVGGQAGGAGIDLGQQFLQSFDGDLRGLKAAGQALAGVYAGFLVARDPRTGATGDKRPAAISVGTNPTFQGSRRTVEAFVLDWDGDLYGQHVGVEFVERLRAMARFPDVEALRAEMDRDVLRTRAVLGSAAPPE